MLNLPRRGFHLPGLPSQIPQRCLQTPQRSREASGEACRVEEGEGTPHQRISKIGNLGLSLNLMRFERGSSLHCLYINKKRNPCSAMNLSQL